MPSRNRLLIVSRSKDAADAVRGLIDGEFAAEARALEAGQSDVLHGVAPTPDLVLLRVRTDSAAELRALEQYAVDSRPPLIVIGDAANAECMRIAMRAGARDFLTEPLARDDLLGSINRVMDEYGASKKAGKCRLIAFVNAKGGSGSTFIACNVAHLFAAVSDLRSALVDLDLQFGTLPQYLDVEPKRGLLEALDVVEDLDGVAINGYLTTHASGLDVLAGLPESALLQQELMTDRFEAVLNLLAANYERVVLDLPRQISPFSALALERAHEVVLVVQQSVPSLHDATRMYDILTRSLAIHSDNIRVVVNRYRKNAAIELSDIRQALHGKQPLTVPNDFRAVTESIDMGIPIYERARRSATTKALMQLERELGGKSARTARGFFPRVLRAG